MAKKKKVRKVPEVLVFTDINHYDDDLAAMVVLSWLAEKGFISLKGIITELGCFEVRRRRAMYAKGALCHLGQPYVRVAPGGDYPLIDEAAENAYPIDEFTNLFESCGMTILRSGMTFLQEYIKAAKDRNIFILLLAPFYDFAKYIKSTEDAVKRKVKKIVVMGGVQEKRDEAGNYLPDPACFNFKIGAPAAEQVFAYAQEKDVRLVIVPPQSVKDMQMGYEFLEGLEASKNPVAQKLLAARGDNPVSLQYDMLAAFALADGEFNRSGGNMTKPDENKNVSIARVADAALLRAKFTQIFKERLLPKKITLAQLKRPQKEENLC